MAKVFESGTNLELEQFSYLSKMQGAFIGIPEEGDGKPPHLKNVSVKKKKTPMERIFAIIIVDARSRV